MLKKHVRESSKLRHTVPTVGLEEKLLVSQASNDASTNKLSMTLVKVLQGHNAYLIKLVNANKPCVEKKLRHTHVTNTT